MVAFVIGGLVLTCTLGAFMALIFTSFINEESKPVLRWIAWSMIAFAIGFGTMALFQWSSSNDKINWNNGYCNNCGTELEFGNAYYDAGMNYSWYCPNCKNVILTKQNYALEEK
jgi:hypothetical protein